MAINVNIPGIGTVSVDGAASEDTLKQLLVAMRSMNRAMSRQQNQAGSGGGGGGGGGGGPAIGPANAMAALVTATQNQIQQAGMFSKVFSTTISVLKTFGGSIGSVMKDIAKTGLAVTTAWMTSANAMADDPIRAGAELINTGIDLLVRSVTTITDTIGKLAGKIPIIGGIFQGASEAFKAAVELAGAVFKVANEFMAAEFQKVVESFGKLNRIGATFGGGMDELNSVVVSSGIPLRQFTDAVVNSRESVTAMGLNVANAAKLMSSGLTRLASTTGASGKSLRDELLLLGYSYQEQGELVAEYTAAMVMAGKSRSEIDRDVEQGTAKYAKSLKIISDITGEDARKRMAEARRESMRASLMNKLSGEQRVAFQQAYTSMSQFPELQEALIQKLSIGEVINPAVAMNESFMGLINNVSRDVELGSKDIIVRTLTGIAETAEELRSRQQDLGTAIDIAKIAGASGVVATAADLFNKVAAVTMTPDQIAEAARNVETSTQNAGKTANAFADATRETTNFANRMEKIANEQMPAYAGLISSAITQTTNALNIALDEANKIGRMGIKSYSEQKAEEIKTQLGTAFDSLKIYLDTEFLPKLAKVMDEALPWWLGGSKGKQEKIASETQRQGDVSAGIAAGDYDAIVEAMQGTAQAPEIQAEGGILNFLGKFFGRMQKRATGGTVSGPDSGYPVLLHGTEAVVPLPDGRSIPVELSQNINASGSINTEKLEMLLSKQTEQVVALTEAVREMITVAQDHRNIARDIYDVSA